jgi:hypothetical protein
MALWALMAFLASAAVFPAPAGPVHWGDTVTVQASGTAWGRMTPLGGDAWLMVHTVFPPDDAPTELRISRSDDRARTWSVIAGVAEDGRDLDNGELIRLADGGLLLAMRSVVEGRSYRLPVYRSEDGGVHWRPLSTIAANEHPGGRTDRGLWEPALDVLADGTLSVLYADETSADAHPSCSQVVSQRLSTDGGVTWSAATRAVSQPGCGAARPGMPVMTRMAGGRYLMVFEVCGLGPDCDVAYQVSDDGRHWPPGLGTRIAHQRCGPYAMTTDDGRVLVTSCLNEVSLSSDDGATWKRVEPPAWPIGFSHSWPAIYQTGADEVAVVNGGAGGALMIRFGTLAPPVRVTRDVAGAAREAHEPR